MVKHALLVQLIRALQKLSLPVLTPTDPGARGGNVAFATGRSEALEAHLREAATELLDIIEAKGREVAQAVALLRSLTSGS